MPKSYLPLRSLVAGFSLAILSIHAATASDWTIRNPRLTGPALNALAASESRAVAVGLQGHVVTSTDGANWSPQTVGTNRHMQDVIYANNTFVAVGALHNDSGVHSLALTSADGLTWTEQPTDSRAWKSIAYGNGTFVVVGDHTIDTSTDGVTWTRRTPSVYADFQAITFGNGQFVTAGVFNDGRGNLSYWVQRSTDGVTWSGEPAPAGVLTRGLAFGDGQFVMVGEGTALTSVDGVNWTVRASGVGVLNDVFFANQRFVAVGRDGTAVESIDGVTWTRGLSGQAQELTGVGFAFGKFVAVGEGSAIVASGESGQWLSLTRTTNHDLRALTYGEGGLVAVGENCESLLSSGGQIWNSRPIINPPQGSSSIWFNGVAYGNRTYVAVGGLFGAIYTSTNGQQWTERNLNLGADNWWGITHANGRFVVVGEASSGYQTKATIMTSTDGVSWQGHARPGADRPLRCAAYGNGLWVVAGNQLFTSSDATNWTPRTIPTTGTVHAAAFAAGKFILAGEVGGVLTSSDGASWTLQSAFGNATVRGLAYGNNQFVAVGERAGTGVIWSSTDGLTWTEDGSAPAPLNAVTFGAGAFTAVGANGFVLQSGSPAASLAIRKMLNGSVELSCHTEIGRQYRLQASTDGRVWNDMANFRAASTASSYRIVDGATVRLYRLVSP